MEISQQELDEIRDKAKRQAEEANHDWIQKGAFLVCRSCDIRHAHYIGTSKVMVGKNERGEPIFEDWKH